MATGPAVMQVIYKRTRREEHFSGYSRELVDYDIMGRKDVLDGRRESRKSDRISEELSLPIC
jgi:hypothetical protein